MLSVLANSRTDLDVLNSIFSRFDALANPDEMVNQLQNLSVIAAAIFLAAGILCLFQGFKYYRVVTVVLAFAIGGLIGYALAREMRAVNIVAGCLAALFAACCWPLMKYAVALMGGLVGAFLGANAWTAIAAVMNASRGHVVAPADASRLCWVGALVGLIVCGMLAFILFKLSVVLFTSVSGATVAVMGALSLLLQIPGWKEGIRSSVSNNAMILPLLVLVPTLIGLILQHSSPDKGGAAGGGGGSKPAAKPA